MAQCFVHIMYVMLYGSFEIYSFIFAFCPTIDLSEVFSSVFQFLPVKRLIPLMAFCVFTPLFFCVAQYPSGVCIWPPFLSALSSLCLTPALGLFFLLFDLEVGKGVGWWLSTSCSQSAN